MDKLIYLSQDKESSVLEEWHEITDIHHFWVRKRFDVLLKLYSKLLTTEKKFCDVGCGRGLLQRQLYLYSGLSVDGIDTDKKALENNNNVNLYLYDIYECRTEFGEKYDVIFVFDVLEHVKNDIMFLKSCAHLLKPYGYMIINVPASNKLFSAYDWQVGHLRRYNLKEIVKLAESSGLTIDQVSYWGFFLYFLVLMRKYYLIIKSDNIIRDGLHPRNPTINQLLFLLSMIERIPQRALGSSIMAGFRKL
jgi:SAM-dependent methyltransferase